MAQLVDGCTYAGSAVVAYLAVVSAVGLPRPRRSSIAAPPVTTFAIMIPAHNEQSVIDATLRSMSELDYPADLFDVHVVADNCTDATVDVASRWPWQVHVRHEPDDGGKGPALNWLFDRLDRSGAQRDVAVVVDADTVVDPGFLTAMNAAFADGAVIAQGFYSVRAPDASAPAALRYAALACRHHLRALGRTRAGASCGLYGNGMAFRWHVLQERRWTGHLVEDAEFQLEALVADGITVEYVPGARLEAEMPDTLDAATSQNQRWERGRIDLATRFARPLAIRSVRGGPAPRRAYADALIDLVVPPLSLVALWISAVATAQLAMAGAASLTQSGHQRRRITRRAILALATLMSFGLHVLAGLWSVVAPRAVYRSLLRAPSMVVWKVRIWVRAFGSKDEVTWRRTMRNAESVDP